MESEEIKRGVYDQCYKGSELVDITSYFKDYKELIQKSDFHKHYENLKRDCLEKALGSDVDDEKLSILADYCDIGKLTVEGELGKLTKSTYEWSKDPVDPLVGEVDLLTVSHTKQRNLLKNHQVHSKYRSEKPILYDPAGVVSNVPLLEPESDVLVYIRVYVPFTSRSKQSSGALGKLSVNYVIAMPGSQTLDKLKDKISCESDHSVSTEMSKAPIRQKAEMAKDVYRSGFFFIEGTFYNDLRHPKNRDNSQVIREWVEARKIGTYRTAKMEETRLDSIVTRFGFPWVYQHQGDCEHLISFSDARLVNASDELDVGSYPRIVRIKARPNRYCMTCGIYSVSWVTTSNNRLPHNPCLFCDSCFKSYNYVKGKKIGSFEAYPYPYNAELLQTLSAPPPAAPKRPATQLAKKPEDPGATTPMDTS